MKKRLRKLVTVGVLGTTALTSYNNVAKAELVVGSPFLTEISEDARRIGQAKGVYASVMMAQAFIESGNGTSGLANGYNNLMGIKGAYKDGGTVNLPTQEEDEEGELYTIDDYFRVYPDWTTSLEDYADLLITSPIYYGALKDVSPDAISAAWELNGVYATDSGYAEKIIDIIERYDLTRFDKPLPENKKVDKENGIEKKVSVARKKGLFKDLKDDEAAKLLNNLMKVFSLHGDLTNLALDMIEQNRLEQVKNEQSR